MPYGVILTPKPYNDFAKPNKELVGGLNSLPERTDIQIKEMNQYLGLSLTKTTDRFNVIDAMDYKSHSILECKHRTNNLNTYPDTIIGVNKYLASRENYPDWDFYASFLFNDGMYYYKFNNKLSLEEQGIFTTTKKYNKHITNGFVKEHMNIPIELLIKVGRL